MIRIPRPFTTRAFALATCALLAAACGSRQRAPHDASASISSASPLVGTWRFVEFESSSDEIGTIRSDDPGKYTMTLEAGGRVTMRLDCNRATGTWAADPADGESGSFTFGPLALTRAQCPQPSLDTRIARDAEYVRTYVLRGDRLYLNLMADGGNYVWERAGGRD
jgi:heat shock protein HslJ